MEGKPYLPEYPKCKKNWLGKMQPEGFGHQPRMREYQPPHPLGLVFLKK